MSAHTKELLDKLTPREAYEQLVQGNKRFVNNLKINRNLLQQMNDTADGQYPFAVALSCMDSRTSVELLFDQGLGDIFSIRVAGNIVNGDILGSMEYACQVVGSKLIVVLGHTRCGAIKGAVDDVKMGHLTKLLDKIRPAMAKTNAAPENLHTTIYAEKVAYTNVDLSIDEILGRSPIISNLLDEGRIGIVGGMYSVENGRVHFIRELFADTHRSKSVSKEKSVLL
ncbi:MAG: carbonic anhydrase [Chitinophagaceae bacterium]|jgi:carbonic anhydrase|nr:carbonic anhydrase [Chitinophagaceae bacterium]